jgi:hypothetical protein
MPPASRFAVLVLSAFSEGHALHLAALDAASHGRWERADLLFEAALHRYRRDIAVEGIARLRVHQLMAQVWSGREPGFEGQRCLEIERRLCTLDRIESPEPPFETVDAHALIGSWHEGRVGHAATGAGEAEPEFARAA